MSVNKTPLTNAMRTFLSRKEITGLTNSQIQEVIEQVNPSYDLSEDEKQTVKNTLVEKFGKKEESTPVDASALVIGESQKMGLELPEAQVTEIADFARNQANFTNNELLVIREAIQGFLIRQHNQKNSGLETILQDSQELSTKLDNEFNQNLEVKLSTFFRSKNESFSNHSKSLVAALNEYQ
jgi:uncharacterized protein YpuA (DUF1002 family)